MDSFKHECPLNISLFCWTEKHQQQQQQLQQQNIWDTWPCNCYWNSIDRFHVPVWALSPLQSRDLSVMVSQITAIWTICSTIFVQTSNKQSIKDHNYCPPPPHPQPPPPPWEKQGTSRLPTQNTSNVEGVSMSWRHHSVKIMCSIIISARTPLTVDNITAIPGSITVT